MTFSLELPDGVLAIEMSGDLSSLAISKENKIVELDFTASRGRALLTSLDALLKQVEFSQSDLSTILVGIGPGSYTGLRIACAGAKTLGYALNIPVAGVGSFEASAWDVLNMEKAPPEIHLILDAYRKEVYHAAFQLHDEGLVVTQEPQVSLASDFAASLSNQASYLGDPKWTDSKGTCLAEKICPRASHILKFVSSKVLPADFVSAYESPEPRYLRPAAYPPAS